MLSLAGGSFPHPVRNALRTCEFNYAKYVISENIFSALLRRIINNFDKLQFYGRNRPFGIDTAVSGAVVITH